MAETALVKPTSFEELVKRLNQMAEKENQSKINLERRRAAIKAMLSVYWFLKKKFGLHENWEMSLEDFKTAEEELKEMGRIELAEFKRGWHIFKPGKIKAWEYYLKFGCFHWEKSPLGDWVSWHGMGSHSYMNFDPNIIQERPWSISLKNLSELVNMLLEEGWGWDNVKVLDDGEKEACDEHDER